MRGFSQSKPCAPLLHAMSAHVCRGKEACASSRDDSHQLPLICILLACMRASIQSCMHYRTLIHTCRGEEARIESVVAHLKESQRNLAVLQAAEEVGLLRRRWWSRSGCSGR